MAVPPVPVRIIDQRPLAPSVTSATSVANGKGDNEMIPGAVHRSSGIKDLVPVINEATGCGQKKIVSLAVPPAPVRVPSQRSLAPSVTSVTTVANDGC